MERRNKRGGSLSCFGNNTRAEGRFYYFGNNTRAKNKKAQFYLVAAILILLAIAGLTSVTTYAITKSEPRQIKDFSAELKEEGPRIIDYGVVNNKNLTKVFENFTEYEYAPYFLKKTQQTSIVFLYGNESDFYVSQYNQEDTGTISASLGGSNVNWNQIDTYSNRTKVTVISGDSLEVNVLGNDYSFDIRANEMFYFVIVQEKDGEKYVEKN